eukprot:GDKK01040889.1.p1 GENE.GDKK01040889.1~~GDKK01040889.1.p1  ORF type:complete len:128 (+),score=22.24 GDKK01040889.1:95-478(+)
MANHHNMSADIVGKFCSLGIVTSLQWQKCHIVIKDRFFRVYLSQHAAETNPYDPMLEIPLDKEFRSSAWKRKEYCEVSNEKKDFFCFYIEQDGMLGPSRLFKIGCSDIALVEKIIRCVEANTTNKTF